MATTVLLIDPNNVTRAIIKYHLCRAGYTVYEALNREDVRSAERDLRPAMIIVDESVDLAESDPQLPHLVLTNLPHPPSNQDSRAFLTKPVLANHLLSAVSSLNR